MQGQEIVPRGRTKNTSGIMLRRFMLYLTSLLNFVEDVMFGDCLRWGCYPLVYILKQKTPRKRPKSNKFASQKEIYCSHMIAP